jgi:hypothetical protein
MYGLPPVYSLLQSYTSIHTPKPAKRAALPVTIGASVRSVGAGVSEVCVVVGAGRVVGAAVGTDAAATVDGGGGGAVVVVVDDVVVDDVVVDG